MNEALEAAPAADGSGDLVLRLRRIEGQVRGITRMVEEQRTCEDIITQLLAVRSAMDRVAGELVRQHVDRCLCDMPADRMRTEIVRVVELLNKIA
jgi:DNA-binding FrmR family transcriptional regulator